MLFTGNLWGCRFTIFRSKGMRKYQAIDKWNTQLKSIYQTVSNRVGWELAGFHSYLLEYFGVSAKGVPGGTWDEILDVGKESCQYNEGSTSVGRLYALISFILRDLASWMLGFLSWTETAVLVRISACLRFHCGWKLEIYALERCTKS